MSLQDVENLSADSLPASAEMSPMRQQVLREVALPMGSHKGLADRSVTILNELDARASRLDTMYRFGALVMKNGMLPPVIVEAKDAIEGTSDQQRRADIIYRLITPAKLVTIQPSWRDYLYVGLRIKAQADPIPSAAVLPKTAAERSYWKTQVQLGYQQGQSLADQIIAANFDRLNRDYLGMLRYSDLLNRGMVDQPQVAVSPQLVSGDRNRLNVGDTLIRVTDHGGFITDAAKWRPVVAPGAAPAIKANTGSTGSVAP